MALFLDAFLLALASSTDNFMVGLSVGISNQSLSFGVNALISICNATGALLASFGGSVLGQNLPPHLPPLLSAIAFGGLALREFWEFWQTTRRKRNLLLKKEEKCQSDESICKSTSIHEEEDLTSLRGINNTSSEGTNLNISRALHLAIPMTLNNLAGVVAGGAIGVTPLQAGLYGLLASFLTMALGHFIGQYFARLSNASFRSRPKNKRTSSFYQCRLILDPSFASGSLLGILSLVSLQEVLSS